MRNNEHFFSSYDAPHASSATAHILVESSTDVKTGSLARLFGSGDLFAFYVSYPSQQLFSATSVGNPFFQTVDTEYGHVQCTCEVCRYSRGGDAAAFTSTSEIVIPEWNREYLNMRTRRSVRRCLLAATLAGSPLYVAAADKPSIDKESSQARSAELRSTSVSAFRAVPQSDRPASGIQLVQYQPDAVQKSGETSTVNGELRRIFRKNGQSMPSMRSRDLPNANSPTMRMVRHRNDVAEAPELSQEEQAKKPGLLKRFLNVFKPKKSRNGEEFLDEQSAVPAVPPPPPIVFNDTSEARPDATGNSVPARMAGFQKSDGQSVFSAGRPRIAQSPNQDAAQPLIQQPELPPADIPQANQPANQKPAGSDSRYQQPPQLQVLQDDGFVDPFGEPEPVSDDSALLDLDRALLDLDSLINAPDSENDAPAVPALSLDAGEPDLANTAATEQGPTTDEPLSTEQPGDPTASSQTTDVITDAQPTESHSEDTESETIVDQTLNESGETAAAEPKSQFVEVPASDPDESAAPSARPTETWAPSKEAVARGRELATPIELKPDPERLRQLSDKARREEQLYRIMSRTGQVGFKGFCPVVLRNDRELIDGRKEYRSKYGLENYQFSSPKAKATFDANPARYAPAGGGSDVVLLVNTNEEVAGILDFSLWYRDRLYMFRSRETQAIFSGDPERYASQY